MIATVLLCLLSTTTFCLCTRGVIALSSAGFEVTRFSGRWGWGLSVQAKRIARGYLIFALVALAAMAFFGAAVSYVELFSSL